MRPQLVALIAASCLTSGWLLASILMPPVAELQVLPERTPRRPAPQIVTHTTPFTERLHLKLQAAPERPTPKRNPFVFGGALRSKDRRAVPGPVVDAPAVIAAPPPAPSPRIRLSGIASTNTDSGLVWTAVISDATGIHLVTVGERIGQFTVAEISDVGVVLTDAAGERHTLRLP